MRSTLLCACLVSALAMVGPAAEAEPLPTLVEAVKKADRAAVLQLLRQGVDVNRSEIDGTTALHWAVEQDEWEIARLLLRAGAHAAAQNRYGITPLHAACVNGNARMIEMLLEAGADPNTRLAGETALMTAARSGSVDALTILITHGADVNAKEPLQQQTALMWAAAENHAAAVQLLARHRADLQARSASGFTPLLYAVRTGSIDAVRALLDEAVDVNEAVQSPGPFVAPKGAANGTMQGRTMLMHGLTALHVAIANREYEIAILLLDRGADPNAEGPGWTPLHQLMWARRPNLRQAVTLPPTATVDSVQFAKALLRGGANVNARQKRELCVGGKEDAGLQRLITPPQEPERAFYLPCNQDLNGGETNLNRTGATPFLLASQHADLEMMRLLLDQGADPALTTSERQTALMVASGVGMFGLGVNPGTNEEAFEAVKLLIALGADVRAVDDNGETALHGAAVRGANEIVQLLVDKGASLTATNSMGWTPLTIADGVLYTFTVKRQPHTAVLLRALMTKQGLDVPAAATPQ